MKVYKTQDIRNVAVLGHGGCGKRLWLRLWLMSLE